MADSPAKPAPQMTTWGASGSARCLLAIVVTFRVRVLVPHRDVLVLPALFQLCVQLEGLAVLLGVRRWREAARPQPECDYHVNLHRVQGQLRLQVQPGEQADHHREGAVDRRGVGHLVRAYRFRATSSGRRQPWTGAVGGDGLTPEPAVPLADVGGSPEADGLAVAEGSAVAAGLDVADGLAEAGELGASFVQAAMTTRSLAGSALPPSPLRSTK